MQEIKDTFTGFEVIKSFGVEEKIQEKSSSTFDRVEADAFRMPDYPRKVHCHQ